MIKASNNPLPHDPNDQYPNKLDRGGYVGTAKDLDDKINEFAFPDDILQMGPVNFVGDVISMSAYDFIWRINNVQYTNNLNFSSTIAPATVGFKRIDVFILTASNNIVKIEGLETDGPLVKTTAPNGTLEVAYIEINGTTIFDPILSQELAADIQAHLSRLDEALATITITPYTSFKPLHKGFGNSNLAINEIGDIFCGWSNDGIYRIHEAQYLGGVLTDSNNFKPLIQTEI